VTVANEDYDLYNTTRVSDVVPVVQKAPSYLDW
jgi:hypothetical protein